MRPERLALVLSGGGAKALAHAGAWAALAEQGLKPQRIAATSLGAVVGACFAAGMSYEEVTAGALRVRRRDVASLSRMALLKGLFAPAVLRPEPLKETIARLVRVNRFDELEVPLTVTATDLDSGALVRFGVGGRTDISLPDALYASCALPLYYPPLVFQGRRLADGGLRATLPLEVIGGRDADLVLAVDVGPALDDEPGEGAVPVPALIRAHNAALRILLARQTATAVEQWRRQAGGATLMLVRPVREREATFAVEHIERYVAQGYRATRRVLAADPSA